MFHIFRQHPGFWLVFHNKNTLSPAFFTWKLIFFTAPSPDHTFSGEGDTRGYPSHVPPSCTLATWLPALFGHPVLCMKPYLDLIQQRPLTHHTSLLCLRHADITHFLHIFAFHRRLGLHLLQLVFEMRNHLSPLLKLRITILFHPGDLFLQLTNFLPTFLLSVHSKTQILHASILLSDIARGRRTEPGGRLEVHPRRR